jgi:hypothetical protein
MEGFRTLSLPQSVIFNHLAMSKSMKQADSRVVATSAKKEYDLGYYTKAALAGGICCSITHGALW